MADIQNFALRAHCVCTACALRAWHSLSVGVRTCAWGPKGYLVVEQTALALHCTELPGVTGHVTTLCPVDNNVCRAVHIGFMGCSTHSIMLRSSAGDKPVDKQNPDSDGRFRELSRGPPGEQA